MGGNRPDIRAGYLRNMPVSIDSTTWKPDMPMEAQIKEQMGEIKQFLYEECIDGIAFEPLLGQEPMEEAER